MRLEKAQTALILINLCVLCASAVSSSAYQALYKERATMATIVEEPDRLEALAIWAGLMLLAVLPEWLSAIADPTLMAAALTSEVPEFAVGALVLRACRVDRIRLKDDRWNALYELTVAGPGADADREIRLSGTLRPPGAEQPPPASAQAPFGSTEWAAYLPDLRLALRTQPPDVDLPILPQLVDPGQARALLQGAIRAGSPRFVDITIESCTPQVMRYKPGSRCTILYRLSYPSASATGRDWPAFVVAKTYQGKKGQTAYDGMRALWNSPLGKGDAVTLAEPLAFVPDLGLLIQGPIPGARTLKDLIRAALRSGAPEVRAELHAYLRRTAAGLAALHQSGVQAGKVRDYADALDDAREMIAELAGVVPDLPGAATPLLDRLTALAATYPPDAEGPAHGSFRPAQVLLHNGRVGFIDFDSFCRSEPARDLALFLSNIISVGLNTGAVDEDDEPVDVAGNLDYLAQLEELTEVFLAEYAALAPISRSRLALWEALDLFTQVLDYWTKVKPARLKNIMFLLERRLRASGLV
jgi:hypothetical protein